MPCAGAIGWRSLALSGLRDGQDLGLTGFGIYTAFGPPSKQLSDPFDDHDD